jgi:predicted transcriptional regulator
MTSKMNSKYNIDINFARLYTATMARKATTFRLDPEVQAGLAMIAELQGRPQNQLVNEAVRALVVSRSQQLEHQLESTLQRLKAYRAGDPTGEKSMAAAMAAEAAVEHDPAEGTRVEDALAAGPASARILERLGG